MELCIIIFNCPIDQKSFMIWNPHIRELFLPLPLYLSSMSKGISYLDIAVLSSATTTSKGLTKHASDIYNTIVTNKHTNSLHNQRRLRKSHPPANLTTVRTASLLALNLPYLFGEYLQLKNYSPASHSTSLDR